MPTSTATTVGFDKRVFLEGGKQFEDLLNKLRAGKQQLEHFRDYLASRIALEEEHAKSIGKLLTKHRDTLQAVISVSGEEEAVKDRLKPVLELKRTVLPAVETMIREQKRVKDAQKAAISSTTKKLCDYGERLSKVAERHLVKERELAAQSGKICMTAKEEEKQKQQVGKLEESLDKLGRERVEVEGKMERCFEEWRVIAEQAGSLISRHEEERERVFADLIGAYHVAVGGSVGSLISGDGASDQLNRQSSNQLNRQSSDQLNRQSSDHLKLQRQPSNTHLQPAQPNTARSAYSSSLEKLAALTTRPATTTTAPPAYHPALTALYDYTAQSPQELSFKQGDAIELLDKEEDPWWRGRSNGRVGLFPSNFVI